MPSTRSLHPINHHIHTYSIHSPMAAGKDMIAKGKGPMPSCPQRTWTDSGVKPHVHSLDRSCRLILSVTTGKWDQIQLLGQGHLSPVHQTPRKVPIQDPHQACQSTVHREPALGKEREMLLPHESRRAQLNPMGPG